MKPYSAQQFRDELSGGQRITTADPDVGAQNVCKHRASKIENGNGL